MIKSIEFGRLSIWRDSTGLDDKQAREHANEAGLGGLVELQEGDCRALPFPDASFDAVPAATTLSHVPDAGRALAEMVRVTRPGGRIGVFDLDGDFTMYVPKQFGEVDGDKLAVFIEPQPELVCRRLGRHLGYVQQTTIGGDYGCPEG